MDFSLTLQNHLLLNITFSITNLIDMFINKKKWQIKQIFSKFRILLVFSSMQSQNTFVRVNCKEKCIFSKNYRSLCHNIYKRYVYIKKNLILHSKHNIFLLILISYYSQFWLHSVCIDLLTQIIFSNYLMLLTNSSIISNFYSIFLNNNSLFNIASSFKNKLK